MTVVVDNAASSAAALDIAAAKMAAISRPTSPTGRCVMMKVGNT